MYVHCHSIDIICTCSKVLSVVSNFGGVLSYYVYTLNLILDAKLYHTSACTATYMYHTLFALP